MRLWNEPARRGCRRCWATTSRPRKMVWSRTTTTSLALRGLLRAMQVRKQPTPSPCMIMSHVTITSQYWSEFMDSVLEVLEELQSIFRDVLDQPDLVLTRGSNAT